MLHKKYGIRKLGGRNHPSVTLSGLNQFTSFNEGVPVATGGSVVNSLFTHDIYVEL